MGKILNTHRQPHSIKVLAKALLRSQLQPWVALCCGTLSLLTSPYILADIAPEIASGLTSEKTAQSSEWMAVTANQHATQAAADIIAAGGSAIDAAIAAQLILGLVEPQSSGIGGGGFLLYWDKNQQQLTDFNGRETAPKAVDKDHFLLQNGENMAFFDAVVGGHSVGTPGLLHMLNKAHQQYGKLPWSQLFAPAINLAKNGFVISPRLFQLLSYMQKTPNGLIDPNMSAYVLDNQGHVKAAGTLLRNPAYAKTLTAIAEQGINAFYHGPIAQQIVNAVQKNAIHPGTLSLSDLSSYRSQSSHAFCHKVETLNVCGASAPASGPIAVAQILSMLSQTPGFYGLAPDSTAFYHRFAEASKLAFADRDKYIADPDFVKLPLQQLFNKDYLKQRSAQIPLLKASKGSAQAGIFDGSYSFSNAKSAEIPSTSHLSIIDKEGNIVSMTSSIEMAFGSQIMVAGFLLNNQLTDFSFSYEDAQKHKIANRIEPGKRPRSSMAPMIIFNQQQQPTLVIGSPGGSRIIDYVAKTIAQHSLLHLDLAQAISSPHVINLNAKTEIEKGGYANNILTQNLQKLGHQTRRKDQTSGLHAIQIKASGYYGVADPRREGSVLGE